MRRVFHIVNTRHDECMKMDARLTKSFRDDLQRIFEYIVNAGQSIYKYVSLVDKCDNHRTGQVLPG